jgi:hypothetical protein
LGAVGGAATGTRTTFGTAAGSLGALAGTGLADSDWAFDDDFSTDLSGWAPPARWRSHGLVVDPGHVSSVDMLGVDDRLPPDDIEIVSGTLWVGAGSQNYGDTLIRCAQPFDFTSGNGIIELETILPALDRLAGWSNLVVSALPMVAPSAMSDNSSGPTPKYGFGIRLNADQAVWSGQWRTSPEVMVWDDHVETILAATSGASADISNVAVTAVRIEFSATHISMWADGVLWYDEDWSPPSELFDDPAWVFIGAHNHATLKYRAPMQSYNANYSGFRFDGPTHDRTVSSRVPDETDPHTPSTGDLAGVPGVDIAYDFPTGTLTLEDVPPLSEAWLLCSVMTDPVSNGSHSSWRLNYSLNGASSVAVAFEPTQSALLSGSASFVIPIDPADLLAGDNTVAFTATGFTGGVPPFIGNIELTGFEAPIVEGVAAGSLGSVGGTIAGLRNIPAVAAGSLGALGGTASGTVPTVTGTAAGSLGALGGTVVGTRTVSGVAAGSLGALTGSGTGAGATPTITGTAAGTLGALSGTVAGTREVAGSAAGSCGAVGGTSSGIVTVIAAGLGLLGALNGIAAATGNVTGAAQGTLGAVDGTAAGVVSAYLASNVGTGTAVTVGPRATSSVTGPRTTVRRAL